MEIVYDISLVQPISDQLNKYELAHPLEMSTFPPILTETSPTTANLNYTIDFMAMYFDEESQLKSQSYGDSDLERQLQIAKEKIAAKWN